MDDYIIFPSSNFNPYASFDYIINEMVKFQHERFMNPDFEREYIACEQIIDRMRFLRDDSINVHGTSNGGRFTSMWGDE